MPIRQNAAGIADQDPAAVLSSPPNLLPLFRRGRWHYSMDTCAVEGAAEFQLGLAPRFLIEDDLRRQQHLLQESPFPVDLDMRMALCREAIEIFRHKAVDIGLKSPQTPEEFKHLMERTTGVPGIILDRWSAMLERSLSRIKEEVQASPLPPGIVLVSLPANTITCLEACLKALIRGDTVWIRPSRREPWSGLRLIAGLAASGWPKEYMGFYPTEHSLLRLLVYKCNRAVVYGGDRLAEIIGSAGSLTFNGPGRSIAIVQHSTSPADSLPWLLNLVAGNCGRFCINVGTIFCLHSTAWITRRLGQMLDRIPLGGKEAEDNYEYPQAYFPNPETANRIVKWIEKRIRPGDRIITKRAMQVAVNGRNYLAPALIAIREARGHPLLGVEVPFPFAVIASAKEEECPCLCEGSTFVHRSPSFPQE